MHDNLVLKIHRSEVQVLSIASSILCVLLCWIDLNEFYDVRIAKNTLAFPFGGEGATPWYYRSETIYSDYFLILGLLFFSGLLIGLWSFIRLNRRIAMLTFAIAFTLLVLQILMAYSE